MEKRNLTLIVLMLVVSILAVFLAQAQDTETKSVVEKGIKSEKSQAPSVIGGCCAAGGEKKEGGTCGQWQKGNQKGGESCTCQKGKGKACGACAKKTGNQKNCPIMGGKINKNISAEHKGKRVYFCCQGCVNEFKKDPDKYVKKLEDEGVTLDKTPNPQKTCPIMGGKINKNISAEHKGKRVYFCCQGCVNEFKKDPDKYVKKLEGKGVTLEKVTKPQETCPVMGSRITSKYYADHEGKRIYFCCPGCPAKFKENPEKYLEILEEKGEVPEQIKTEM